MFRILTAGALVLTTAAVITAPANASPAPLRTINANVIVPHHISGTVIYDQTDNLSGFGVSSQNFEPSLDAYDTAAADDFKLTGKATVTTVVVEGFDSPGGNFVTSATVTFYKNAHGLPGAVKKSVTKPVDDDGIGDLTIDVGTIKLKRGTYWLSVVVNEDYLPYDTQWFWATSATKHGKLAVWQNPGGGLGVCPTWTKLQSCNGDGASLDMMFRLLGP